MKTDKIHPRCTALVDWRVANGLTQAQAAHVIGATKQQIAKWEAGRALPRYRMLQRIVMATGLSADSIVGIPMNPKPAGMRSTGRESVSNIGANMTTSGNGYCVGWLNRIRPSRRRAYPAAVLRTLQDRTTVTDSCWLFTGWKTPRGYGQIQINATGKRVYAHRLAYELTHGPIPAGMVICHRCDVPGCVNPDHLFAATQGDNIRDAHRKGRYTAWHRTGKRLNGEPSKV